MGSFCKQCSLELFDIDYKDFNYTSFMIDEGGSRDVFCDRCGVTRVDASGNCLAKCKIKHLTLSTSLA